MSVTALQAAAAASLEEERGGPLRIQISSGDQAVKGSWLSLKRRRKRWLHKYATLPPAVAGAPRT